MTASSYLTDIGKCTKRTLDTRVFAFIYATAAQHTVLHREMYK